MPDMLKLDGHDSEEDEEEYEKDDEKDAKDDDEELKGESKVVFFGKGVVRDFREAEKADALDEQVEAAQESYFAQYNENEVNSEPQEQPIFGVGLLDLRTDPGPPEETKDIVNESAPAVEVQQKAPAVEVEQEAAETPAA